MNEGMLACRAEPALMRLATVDTTDVVGNVDRLEETAVMEAPEALAWRKWSSLERDAGSTICLVGEQDMPQLEQDFPLRAIAVLIFSTRVRCGVDTSRA